MTRSAGALSLILSIAWGFGARSEAGLLLKTAIQAPRFAAGDVTGDGVSDLIVAGRIGPFRAVTDPISSNRARVVVYPVGSDGFGSPISYDVLGILDDVAAADIDGDGVDEIVTVGAGELTVLRRSGGKWHATTRALAGSHSYRVASGDLDGDGIAEVIVASYGVEDDGELGETELQVFSGSGGMSLVGPTTYQGHVGAMAVIPSEREGMLLVETGMGDEGWRMSILSLGNSGEWREIGSTSIPSALSDRPPTRAVGITPAGVNAALLGLVDGSIHMLRGLSTSMRADPLRSTSPGLTDLLVLPQAKAGTDPLLIMGSASSIRSHPLLPF